MTESTIVTKPKTLIFASAKGYTALMYNLYDYLLWRIKDEHPAMPELADGGLWITFLKTDFLKRSGKTGNYPVHQIKDALDKMKNAEISYIKGKGGFISAYRIHERWGQSGTLISVNVNADLVRLLYDETEPFVAYPLQHICSLGHHYEKVMYPITLFTEKYQEKDLLSREELFALSGSFGKSWGKDLNKAARHISEISGKKVSYRMINDNGGYYTRIRVLKDGEIEKAMKGILQKGEKR